MAFSVIIPSANADNLIPCVRAVLKCEPGLHPSKIIIVDDGAKVKAESELPGVTWVEGQKPFCFARNCNLGIAEASPWDDIILLNDDALLETPGGFTALVVEAENWGILSPRTNSSGNPNHTRNFSGLFHETKRCVPFICVCIPRTTLEHVGKLDERFTCYGWEDVDYCKRVKDAGLKLGIFGDCFVDHRSLTSTFRGNGAGDIAPGRELYIAKHGTAEL